MQAYSHKIQDFHGTSPYLRLCLYLFHSIIQRLFASLSASFFDSSIRIIDYF